MPRATPSRTTLFLNFIHPVFIQNQPASAIHVKQSYQVSFWLSMRGKQFPGEVGDILEGPGYKVHLECPVQH